MKRLLTAFIIAMAIHVLALSLVFKRFSVDRFELNQAPPVTMTFTYREPIEKPASKRPRQPVVRPPEKDRVPTPKKIKPQKRNVDKTVKPKAPIIPPVVAPQSVPLDPKPPPEPEAQTTATLQDDRSMKPPVDPTINSNQGVDASTESKHSVAPPIRKARPLYRQNPPPRYPRIARSRGYEGRVVLEVKVLRDGTVGDLRVLDSSGFPVLDKAAVKSVRRWLFEPGMQGDLKVDMWVRVPIRFKIE